MVRIREVRETDDFEAIYGLLNDTFKRYTCDDKASYGPTAESLRSNYCGEGSQDKGFIAETGDSISAFMGVSVSSYTNNGYIECGFVDDGEIEHTLNRLLSMCTPLIREREGDKIFKFAGTKFGQVRNKEITLWEKMGFVSDEYSLVTTILDLTTWKQSDDFDATGIQAAIDIDYEEIKQILIEDGEDQMAELFQNQYSGTKKPDEVVITLKDQVSDEIACVAYYRVIIANRGTDNEFMDAVAFGIHARPAFSIDRAELQRFLQGCLVSMKQLGLMHVITRITLKNFNIFSAMVGEGFHNEGLEQANTMRLYKSLL